MARGVDMISRRMEEARERLICGLLDAGVDRL